MSQRRTKLPTGQPRQYTVKLVCTDRGQHDRVVLFHLMDTRGDADEGSVVIWPEGPRGRAPLTSWSPDAENEGFHFRCGRCGRNPELRQETLFRLLDGLAGLDSDRAHPVVDISLLPF